ncbi:MAG: N-acetylmuramoyl-L-alanine amidase [Marinifilaceae bacterium]
MRTIKFIAVHCTATAQNATIDSIKKYWREQLGWKSPGYHYIVKPNGDIVNLHPEDKVSNGVSGHNSYTINVCYIGGIDSKGKAVDNRTQQQKASLYYLLERIKERYPKAIIQGHRDFPKVAKACPCFDAKKEYANIK